MNAVYLPTKDKLESIHQQASPMVRFILASSALVLKKQHKSDTMLPPSSQQNKTFLTTQEFKDGSQNDYSKIFIVNLTYCSLD